MFLKYVTFRPSAKEQSFQMIMNGNMNQLIKGWGRIHYLTQKIYNLLSRMLTKEETRITMEQIKQHPWLQ